jgi:putative membrane protein
MTLEGIPDYEAMREFLYSRMRGSHHPHEQAAAASTPDSLAGILTEVAQELKAIRAAMEQRNA